LRTSGGFDWPPKSAEVAKAVRVIFRQDDSVRRKMILSFNDPVLKK